MVVAFYNLVSKLPKYLPFLVHDENDIREIGIISQRILDSVELEEPGTKVKGKQTGRRYIVLINRQYWSVN